jgi:Fur family ferric uptake transcriptional regulator
MPHEYSLRSVQVALPPAERFGQFLKTRGKRLTRQRQLIVEQVYSHHDHFDADELMDHLSGLIASHQVSRPTVYRTLGELVEAKLLRKMALGGRSVYEHDYGYPSHDHLHCDVCNRLIEFHSDAVERLREAVAREYDFQAVSHRLFVSGVCSECRRRGLEGAGRQ